MSYFRCGSCHTVYQGHYPPDDTCTKCNTGTIRLVREADHQPKAYFHSLEGTMTVIKPEVKLFTNQDADSTSIQINSLILAFNGNHYHLPGGTGDTIHVFIQSIAIYVLSINQGHGHMTLNAFMVPQPDAINGVYMHTPQDIEDILGAKWDRLSPKAITEKLINYLM